ncbi:hypothetical protein AB0283_04180 [Micromonospora vinacea]|uniref:hypothetical protein n=1 Tax=Micromonospora vinacea TaxID=709878 RepID=UPI00344C9F76
MADPSISFDERRRLAREQGKRARQRADELRGELNQLLLAGNPLAFYLQLSVWEALARSAVSADAAFGYDAAVEFLGGLVTSLPAHHVVARLDVDHPPEQMLRLDRVLREYCIAEDEGGVGVDTSPGDREGGVRALLRYESRLDRMRGYELHLKEIVTTVFAAVDRQAVAGLGFPPSLTIQLAEAMERIR